MPLDPNSNRRNTFGSSEGTSAVDSLLQPFESSSDIDLVLLDIPGSSSANKSSAKRMPNRAASNGTRSGAGRPVLVVDRSSIARKFLTQRLGALGYTAHAAEDGEEALEMIEQQAYTIIFSEVSLSPQGGLDGLRLCQAIKQKPDHPMGVAPAVVMVTGLRGPSDRVRGSLAGCDAYLTKPLTEADFLTALSEVDPLFARASETR
jgi:CheY-like chemotaxis protein